MFWAPDEVAGATLARVEELRIENPGILTYLPEEIAGLGEPVIGESAREEDEPLRTSSRMPRPGWMTSSVHASLSR